LFAHPDYANAKLRLKNRDALNVAIGAKIIQRTSAQWIDILNTAGVPCGPIYSIDQVFADPQVKHLGMGKPVEHYALGPIELVAPGVKLTRTPSELRTAAPDRGEQTDEILHEYGYTEGEIADFRARAII